MTEITNGERTPGIVLFVAILNFISAAFFMTLAMISLVAVVFGNVMGIYDVVSQQMTTVMKQPNFSYGVTVLFAAGLFMSLVFVAFFVAIGAGLLRRKKFAWYLQIAMSVIGLVGFPIGTLLNAAILVLFFQPAVREHFKV